MSITRKPWSITSPLTWAVLMALLVCLVNVQSATAQPRSDRQDPWESLLRSFVDSQLNRHLPDNRPQVPNNVPAEVRQAQSEAAAMTQGLAQLVNQLSREIYRVPALRASLAESRQAHAEASVLSQRLQYVREVGALRTDYAQLNQRWRDLAYQLQNTHYISQTSLNLATSISQRNQKLQNLMGIDSQLNRQDLIEAVATMDTELRRLQEDIELELARSPHRQTYVYEAMQQRQHAQVLASLIRDRSANQESMVKRFNQMHQKWIPLANGLLKINNRYLTRDVERVQHSHHELAALLRIPQTVDVSHLKHQVDQLDHDIHELYQSISLAQLVDLGPTKKPVVAARSFHDACVALQETISDQVDTDDLIEVYWYVDDEWPAMKEAFAAMDDAAVNQQLQQIETRLIYLRETLGVRSRLDSRAALEAAAALEGHARHLAADINLVFQSRRYRTDFQRSTNQLMANFQASAAALNKDMAAGVPVGRLRANALVLVQRWNALQGEMKRFLPEHREHLLEQGAQIAPLVVTLNTYLAE